MPADCPPGRDALTFRKKPSMTAASRRSRPGYTSSCCVIALAVSAWLALGLVALGQSPARPLSPTESVEVVSLAAAGGSQSLLRELVLNALPAEYENTKQWGQTKRVWDGVDLSLDGLRLDTKRRWRDVNHGTWKRYKAWLISPHETFDFAIENIRPTEDGRAAFDVVVIAQLGTFARLSEWRRGVQLISVGVDAEAVVRLQLTCAARLRLEFRHLLPDIVIEPEVTAADLRLVRFDLQRISDLHGPLVKELGESLHDVLQDEINERRPRLVAQANRQIARHQDKLRLSLQDLAQDGWQKARQWLGES